MILFLGNKYFQVAPTTSVWHLHIALYFMNWLRTDVVVKSFDFAKKKTDERTYMVFWP